MPQGDHRSGDPVVICSMAVRFGASHPLTEQGGVSLTNLAADRSALSDKHP
jgi:hypothetical protein